MRWPLVLLAAIAVPVAHVLAMTTGEMRHPITFVIETEAND